MSLGVAGTGPGSRPATRNHGILEWLARLKQRNGRRRYCHRRASPRIQDRAGGTVPGSGCPEAGDPHVPSSGQGLSPHLDHGVHHLSRHRPAQFRPAGHSASDFCLVHPPSYWNYVLPERSTCKVERVLAPVEQVARILCRLDPLASGCPFLGPTAPPARRWEFRPSGGSAAGSSPTYTGQSRTPPTSAAATLPAPSANTRIGAPTTATTRLRRA